MINLDGYGMNHYYREICKQGFTIEVTTGRRNRGSLFLVWDNKIVAEVQIKTNGRGTKAILEALHTSKSRTHLDEGLRELLASAKRFAELGLTNLGQNTDAFVATYNAAVVKHGEKAYERVQSEIEHCPGAQFPRLYRLFSNEILSGLTSKKTGSDQI